MKKLLVGGAVILSAGLAGTAAAAAITWDTIHNSSSTSDNCSAGIGNSCTFNKDGEILKARAYATNNNNGSGEFEEATIAVYNGGIGVRNPDQWTEWFWPQHGVDSYGRNDLVVFEYASEYKSTGFEIGWKFFDSDIRAWVGGEDLGAGYNFEGVKFADLAGLGFTSENFNNVPINTQRSLDSDATGLYLILTPRHYNDFFKISQITGERGIVVPPPPPDPQNPVPEPGTAALLGIALAGFWANRRRKS